MDDTISRAAVLEIIREYCPDEPKSKDLREYWAKRFEPLIKVREEVEKIPLADRWIPCSERLPEDYTDVLVWFEYYRYGDYNRLYQMHGIGNYMSEYDSWMINHETGWRKLRVFAWMPLPEPYKEHPDADHD